MNIERFKEEGYEVGVYNHYKNPEQLWESKYRKYIVLQEPAWNYKYSAKFQGRIAFRSIEDYAQFLTDEYGWTTPDSRIYYKNGEVKEIFKNEE